MKMQKQKGNEEERRAPWAGVLRVSAELAVVSSVWWSVDTRVPRLVASPLLSGSVPAVPTSASRERLRPLGVDDGIHPQQGPCLADMAPAASDTSPALSVESPPTLTVLHRSFVR